MTELENKTKFLWTPVVGPDKRKILRCPKLNDSGQESERKRQELIAVG